MIIKHASRCWVGNSSSHSPLCSAAANKSTGVRQSNPENHGKAVLSASMGITNSAQFLHYRAYGSHFIVSLMCQFKQSVKLFPVGGSINALSEKQQFIIIMDPWMMWMTIVQCLKRQQTNKNNSYLCTYLWIFLFIVLIEHCSKYRHGSVWNYAWFVIHCISNNKKHYFDWQCCVFKWITDIKTLFFLLSSLFWKHRAVKSISII